VLRTLHTSYIPLSCRPLRHTLICVHVSLTEPRNLLH
jgi:hypothetical protein